MCSQHIHVRKLPGVRSPSQYVVVNENVLDHDESVQVSCLRGNGSSLQTGTRLTMISPMLMFRAHDATTNQMTWAAERHSLRLVKNEIVGGPSPALEPNRPFDASDRSFASTRQL